MIVYENGAQHIVSFQYSDAGRSMSRRPRSKNDCTVRALAVVCEVSFDDAYDALAQKGREPHRGFRIPKRLYIGVWKLTWQAFQAVKGEPRVTPWRFVQSHPQGRYILRVSKHVCAVVDGVIIDDHAFDPGRRVYGAWTTERA